MATMMTRQNAGVGFGNQGSQLPWQPLSWPKIRTGKRGLRHSTGCGLQKMAKNC